MVPSWSAGLFIWGTGETIAFVLISKLADVKDIALSNSTDCGSAELLRIVLSMSLGYFVYTCNSSVILDSIKNTWERSCDSK